MFFFFFCIKSVLWRHRTETTFLWVFLFVSCLIKHLLNLCIDSHILSLVNFPVVLRAYYVLTCVMHKLWQVCVGSYQTSQTVRLGEMMIVTFDCDCRITCQTKKIWYVDNMLSSNWMKIGWWSLPFCYIAVMSGQEVGNVAHNIFTVLSALSGYS